MLSSQNGQQYSGRSMLGFHTISRRNILMLVRLNEQVTKEIKLISNTHLVQKSKKQFVQERVYGVYCVCFVH